MINYLLLDDRGCILQVAAVTQEDTLPGDERHIFRLPEDANIRAPEYNPDFYYVKDGALTKRPKVTAPKTSIVADGTDTVVFNVPEGTIVTIEGLGTATVEDGTLEFVAETADDYTLRFRNAWPYIDTDIIITATAA